MAEDVVVRDVRARLEELKGRIEEDFGAESVFFFPAVEEQGIAGYWGSGPIVFVADRPSRPPAKHRAATRRFAGGLHDALTRHGFGNAHLTDLVKHYPGTGKGRAALVELNWPYFLEELEIVDARIVVAVGSLVFSDLKRRLPIPVLRIPHYAYRFGDPAELRRKFDEAMDLVETARLEFDNPTGERPLAIASIALRGGC